MKVLVTLIALVGLVLAGPLVVSAAPVTADFSGAPAGNLGTPSYTVSGIIADAYHFDGSTWSQSKTTVFRRNDVPNDAGIGVCSPNQQSSGDCAATGVFSGGGGDINEIDNSDQREMIRLTLPAGFKWVSVTLSSLDCNGDCAKNSESGLLHFGSSTGDLTSVDPGTFTESFAGVSDSSVNFLISLTGDPAETATYLYFFNTHISTCTPPASAPLSPAPDSDCNNDYLVWKAVVESTEDLGGAAEDIGGVPGPATLLLLGAGLLASRLRFRR